MEQRKSQDDSELKELNPSTPTSLVDKKEIQLNEGFGIERRKVKQAKKFLKVGCMFFKLKSFILLLEGGLLLIILLQLILGFLADTVITAVVISATLVLGILQIITILIVCFSFQLVKANKNLEEQDFDDVRDETSEKPLENQEYSNPEEGDGLRKLDYLRKKRLLLVLRNEQEEPNPEYVEKRFSNNSEIFNDGNELFLQKLISHSEGSAKSSEEQGNTMERVFESLKTVRDRRIRDTLESPDFRTISSKQSFQEMSFAGSRGSGSMNFRKRKIGKSDKNLFQRRSDMFSFSNENIGSIKSFLSSRKSTSSAGEDLAKSKLLKRDSRKKKTPDFIASKTRRRNSPRMSRGGKRRMGQFYKTSYFKMQLK